MTDTTNPGIYYVTITEGDGSTVHETWKQDQASHFVRRQVHLINSGETRLQVDPATDATGALWVRRTVGSGRKRPAEVTRWDLAPVVRPKLSDAQFDSLAALAGSEYTAGAGTYPGGRVHLVRRRGELRPSVSLSGFDALSPARFRVLLEKGWASLLTGRMEEGTPVVLSLSGRVALALAHHQTRTSSPTGYHKSADSPDPSVAASGTVGPWRKGGMIYDGTSWAVCSCGALKGRILDRRYLARSVTRSHRAHQVMLWIGASEKQAEATAQRAALIGATRPRVSS